MKLQEHTITTEDGWRLQLLHVVPAQRRFVWPVLCTHGFSQNHLCWLTGGFAQSLAAKGMDVYLLDLRGHGGSSREVQWSGAPPADLEYGWDVDDYFFGDMDAALRWVRDRHRMERVVLCGHSLGGILSMVRSLRSGPREVAALVMLGAPLELTRAAKRVRLASFAVLRARTLAQALRIPWKRLPMAAFFRALDRVFHGTRPGLGSLLPFLVRHDRHQLVSRLWNPHSTERTMVRELLQRMDCEPMGVVCQLAAWATRGGLRLGEVDYLERLGQLAVPSLGVWGDEDLLAPMETGDCLYAEVDPAEHQRLLLSHTNHIDLTAGKPIVPIIDSMLQLLERVSEEK